MHSIELLFHILFTLFIIVMTIITVYRKSSSAIKNHSEIQESIALLQNRLGKPKSEYFPDQSLYEKFSKDPENNSYLTALAYDILNHCDNKQWDIPVCAVKQLGPNAAGQYVHSNKGSEIRILIGDNAHDNIVFSVLIHECMHHFLRTNDISFMDSHKNEVLTDTAALYLGFSKYMNKGYIGVGYLKYRELLYAEKMIKTLS